MEEAYCSLGGILALGLFKMNWPVEEAIRQFQSLSDRAFSKRFGLKVPIYRHAAQLLYSHRFDSAGIEGALQQAYGHGNLFGYNEASSSEKVKVGVAVGVPGGRRPYLLTNYSRNSTGPCKYHRSRRVQDELMLEADYLVREDDPADDMKIWEA